MHVQNFVQLRAQPQGHYVNNELNTFAYKYIATQKYTRKFVFSVKRTINTYICLAYNINIF